MQISDKSVYAIAATVALIAITTRVATTQTQPVTDSSLVAQTEVADTTPSRYDNVPRPDLSNPRDGVQKIKVASLPDREAGKTLPDAPDRTVGDDDSAIVDNPVREPNVDPSASESQDAPLRTTPPTLNEESSVLTQEPVPARAGELTDQAVYELYVSGLDANDRRAFRATWALMSAEERQDWLQGARSTLAGG